jgi:dTDP-4-amino-4,6-dideoxygalactose transaminase
MDSGGFVNGPRVESFERSFAATMGRSECVGLASGLDALRLSLLALGLEAGEEVVVPAMTFVASFEAVLQAGGVPVVVDVRDDDCGLDVAALSATVGARTRWVMPVHLYGQMVDVRALRDVAEQNDLTIIEDACQAHGAVRDGISAGTVGAAAAFSFYPTKNLGAIGDAGALVVDDPSVASRARALREHGQASRYRSELIGYTARLDALQAALLSLKLPHLPAWNAERGAVATHYSEALSGVGDLRLPERLPGATHVWHVYAVRTAEPESLAEYLADRGIGTGRHYPEPPHLSLALANLGHKTGAFPVAEAIARETLSLPIYPGITEAQLEAVVTNVRRFFDRG